MQDVYDALGRRFDFDRLRKPDDTQIALALAALVVERFRLLDIVHRAHREHTRKRAKGIHSKLAAVVQPEETLARLSASSPYAEG